MKFLNIFSFGVVLVSSLTAVTALPIAPVSIIARDSYGSDVLFARGDLEAREPWGWLAKIAKVAAPHVLSWVANRFKRDFEDDLLDAITSRSPQDDDDLADILSQLSRRDYNELVLRDPIFGSIGRWFKKNIPNIIKYGAPIVKQFLGGRDLAAVLARAPQDDELADILSQLSGRDYHELDLRDPIFGSIGRWFKKNIPNIIKYGAPIVKQFLGGRDFDEFADVLSRDFSDDDVANLVSALSRRDIWDDILDTREIDLAL
jgi:hypothetical protein